MQNTLHSCRILMKLEFSQYIFEEGSISIFVKIHSMRAELFPPDGRTDGQDDANSRVSQLRKRA
jgi:hypothetical protein